MSMKDDEGRGGGGYREVIEALRLDSEGTCPSFTNHEFNNVEELSGDLELNQCLRRRKQ